MLVWKGKIRMEHRKVLILLTALGLLTNARVCADPTKASASALFPAQKVTRDGTLVIGDSNPSTVINPVLVSSGVAVSVAHLVYSRLMRLDPKGEMEPELAQSWSISDDHLVYTFHLKPGIHFHDGVELTSDDVRFTYETISDPLTHSPFALGMRNVLEYRNPDRYEFQVVLKKPQLDFLNDLVAEILPAHLYRGGRIDANPVNLKPVGSGPFKFGGWTSDGQIVLEANENYFEGRPLLDRIVFKIYRGKSEVWSALMRGEVDMARFLRVEDYEQTKNDPSFKTYALPLPLFYGIFYDLNSFILQDLRVRQAISCAINRPRMIRLFEKGYGLESWGPFQPGYWAYNPDIEKFNYDPVRSMKMLKEAGWADTDRSGILEKDGKPLVIRMLVDGKDSKLREIAMCIRQDLQEIGIRLEVIVYQDPSEVIRNIKNVEAHLMLFYGSATDAHDAVKAWDSDDLHDEKTWLGHNTRLEIDKLTSLGRMATDRAERRQTYMKLQKILYENQISCFLYFPYVFHAVSRRIQNTDELLDSFLPDYFIKKLYVDNRDTERG